MFLRPFGSKRDKLERRFDEIGRFRAENRPKSKVKIWKRTENVVTLHRDHNGKMATREARHRVSNTMKKHTQLWQRFCMK